MADQQDQPWYVREKELRFAESAMRMATAADRMSDALDGFR